MTDAQAAPAAGMFFFAVTTGISPKHAFVSLQRYFILENIMRLDSFFRSLCVLSQYTAHFPEGVDSVIFDSEKISPLTMHLSELVLSKPSEAASLLLQADIASIRSVTSAQSDVDALQEDIRSAINAGCHIFFIGSGSSGRLLVQLERIMRQHHLTLLAHFSFAGAGADSTVPRSIADFENNMMYGVRQLLQAGWKPGDLLVTVSAGGTARFLLEILKYACENGDRRPTMVFGNPIDQLAARCSSGPISVD